MLEIPALIFSGVNWKGHEIGQNEERKVGKTRKIAENQIQGPN